MKAGRVIGGDEHDARTLAQRIVDDARAEADRLHEAARVEIAKSRHDAEQLARRLVQDARIEAERLTARADADAALRRDRARFAQRVGHAPAIPAIDDTADAAPATEPARAVTGTVDEVVGLVIRATVPGVALGEIVRIDRRDREPLAGEVVGFRGEQAVVLPLGDIAGVAPAGGVWRTGAPLAIRCGDDLLGRVLDGLGAPLDGGPPLTGRAMAVDRSAPAALARPAIAVPQPTGVRALDAMLTLAAASASACSRRRASASRPCSVRSRAARPRTSSCFAWSASVVASSQSYSATSSLRRVRGPSWCARPATRRRWSGCARSTPPPRSPSGFAIAAAHRCCCSATR